MHTYYLGEEIELEVDASYGGGLLGEIVLHGRVKAIDGRLLTLELQSGDKTLTVDGIRSTSRDLRPRKVA